MATALPSAVRIIMNPPPPRLPASGQVTASASATATAASTALPPFFMTSAPIFEAASVTEETMACGARTGSAAQRGTARRSSRTSRRFIARKCMTGGKRGRPLPSAPVVGVDRDVVVAEVARENDGGGIAAAEVEHDGDALAAEDARGILLPVHRRRAVRDERHGPAGEHTAA